MNIYMNTIDNRRLKIGVQFTTDQCMLKFKMLLKGSQFYYYSNTVFDMFVLCLPQYPVLIWGDDWKYQNQTKMLQMVASNGNCITVPTTQFNIEKPLVLLILPTCIYVDIVLPLSQFPRALRVQFPLFPIHMLRRYFCFFQL